MKIIAISGEIGWDVWPDEIRSQINAAKGEDIEFQISSPGGYIYDGLEIFNLIRGYEGHTTTKAIGMAASMASYLLMAGDKKIAKSNAIFMIHNARAFTGGDQNAHEKVAKILRGMSTMLGQEYIAQSGKTKKEVSKLMDEETYYFGNEILDAGFVDEIEQVEEVDAAARDNLQSQAVVKVAAVIEKLKASPENFETIDKIAALLPQSGAKTPVNQDPNHEEKMTFEEFCAKFPEEAKRITAWLEDAEAKNKVDLTALSLPDILALAPQAQTEQTQAITDAQTAVAGADIAAHAAKVKKITNVLKSDAYDKKRKSVAVRALADEITIDAFDTIIAMYDSDLEELASAAASGEQPADTPPGGADMGDESSINSPKHQANISNLKDRLNLSPTPA